MSWKDHWLVDELSMKNQSTNSHLLNWKTQNPPNLSSRLIIPENADLA